VEEALYTGFTIRLALSILFVAAAFFIAPLWAGFFENPLLTAPTRVLLLLLLIGNLAFIPQTRLIKELRFKEETLPRLYGRIAYSITAILLALKGFSYWSLVYGMVAQSLVRAFSLSLYSPWKPRLRFNLSLARKLMGFGGFILATSLIFMVRGNLDNAAIGKLIGATALGYYTIAYKWAGFGTKEISMSIDIVLFPAYTRISEDIQRLGRAYLKTLKYATMVSIPMTFGFFAIAPEFVTILLGAKWTPAITPLRILCAWGFFTALTAPSYNAFYAIGKPQLTTYITGLTTLLMGLLIIPAARLNGILGVSALVSILSILGFTLTLLMLSRHLKLSLTQLLSVPLPQTLASIAMLLLIAGFKHSMLLSNLYPPLYLALLIALGATAYVLALHIITRGGLREDVKYVARSFFTKE